MCDELDNLDRAIEQARRDAEEIEAAHERIKQRAEVLKRIAEHRQALAQIEIKRARENALFMELMPKIDELRQMLKKGRIH